MKRIKRIVAVTGTYTNNEGVEKKSYTTIGTLMQRDDGSQCIKMESIPLGWNGWASFYDFDDKKNTGVQESKPAPADDLSDEIPF